MKHLIYVTRYTRMKVDQKTYFAQIIAGYDHPWESIMATPLKIATPDLQQASYARALKDDLDRLSDAAKGENFDAIDFPEPAELFSSLQIIVDGKHPQHSDCRKVRHIASILRSYADKLAKNYTEALDALKKIIGSTPVIEQLPELADDQHFARTLATNREAWKQTACEKPVRGKKKDQIHFLVKDDRAVVRAQLKASAESDAIRTLTVNDETFYLNLLDFQYYPEALLHADHMESSAELLSRQTELVEAMNHNPRLKTQVIADHGKFGYFTEVDEKIVGTYWFYMAFHNSLSNVWHLLASMNSGDKGADSPLAWLAQTPLGRDFVAERGEDINQSSLFYCLNDGTTLQQAFTSWVQSNRAEAYKTAQTIAQEYKEKVAKLQTGEHSVKQLRDIRFEAAVRMKTASHSADADAGAASADNDASDDASWGSVSPREAAEHYAVVAASDSSYLEAKARLEHEEGRMRERAIQKARDARTKPRDDMGGTPRQIPSAVDPANRINKKPRTASPPKPGQTQ